MNCCRSSRPVGGAADVEVVPEVAVLVAPVGVGAGKVPVAKAKGAANVPADPSSSLDTTTHLTQAERSTLLSVCLFFVTL